MTVNIYKAKKNMNKKPFIVECNRLRGENSIFRRIFGLLSESLSDEHDQHDSSVVDSTSPDLIRHSSIAHDSHVPMDAICTEEEEAASLRAALQAIVAMASAHRLESRLVAARLLCDLTANETVSGNAAVCSSPEVINALVQLARRVEDQDGFALPGEDEVRYCALLAISNLSRLSAATKAVLIDAGMVQLAIKELNNGNYKDAHIRRECASMLRNLSCGSMAKKVVSALGYSKVNSLFPIIDGLEDERMKFHATMAKESLMHACIAVV